MRPKAIWLTTLGLSCLAVIGAVPLGQAASQFWKPEVAHAAKVTAQLFQNKALNPVSLTRRNRAAATAQPVGGLSTAKSQVLVSYTLAKPLTFGYSAFSPKSAPSANLATASQPTTLTATPDDELVFTGQPIDPQDWHTSLEKSLREQHYQIKKLELSLATEQLKDGKISHTLFNQKAAAYQIAQQEFKQFLNSPKMTD